MTQKLVVVGAGMASGRMLEHLIDGQPGDWDVTLFNAEPRGNYNRIMLSPVLAGDKTYEEIVTHDDTWYATRGVTCRFGEKVANIDRAAKTVTAANGDVLTYDKLVLATGSNPFIIPLPGHDLGGVIAYRDLEDTERMMALAPGQKAVVIGGGRPDHLDRGWYVEPTLFADVDNAMTIAQEEIFGPVLVVIGFDDDDDAVRIANESPYGLSGMITSADLDRAKAVARRIRTGTLGINGGIWYGADAPFGGYKGSGLGRQCGVEGLEIFTETKTVGWPAEN